MIKLVNQLVINHTFHCTWVLFNTKTRFYLLCMLLCNSILLDLFGQVCSSKPFNRSMCDQVQVNLTSWKLPVVLFLFLGLSFGPPQGNIPVMVNDSGKLWDF